MNASHPCSEEHCLKDTNCVTVHSRALQDNSDVEVFGGFHMVEKFVVTVLGVYGYVSSQGVLTRFEKSEITVLTIWYLCLIIVLPIW